MSVRGCLFVDGICVVSLTLSITLEAFFPLMLRFDTAVLGIGFVDAVSLPALLIPGCCHVLL